MRHAPVFIIGSVRTGTTAITRGLQLAGYPGHNEGHFITLFPHLAQGAMHWYKTVARGKARPKVLLYDQPYEAFMEKFVSFVRTYMAEVYGGDLWLYKTGGRRTIEALPFLKRVFPEARIVYCRRNPYEVMASRLLKFPNVGFERHCSLLAGALLAWASVRGELPDWIEIDQREILNDPEQIADRVAEHLLLTTDERMRFARYITKGRPQRTSPDYAQLNEENVGWSAEQRRHFREVFAHVPDW